MPNAFRGICRCEIRMKRLHPPIQRLSPSAERRKQLAHSLGNVISFLFSRDSSPLTLLSWSFVLHSVMDASLQLWQEGGGIGNMMRRAT